MGLADKRGCAHDVLSQTKLDVGRLLILGDIFW
jgi:hypothetical protein